MVRRISRVPREWTQRRDHLARSVAAKHSGSIALLFAFTKDADAALKRGSLDPEQWAQVQFSASSLLNNIGDDLGRRDAVVAGVALARKVLVKAAMAELALQLQYNVAAGLTSIWHIDVENLRQQHPAELPVLLGLQGRAEVREARALFASIGHRGQFADLRGRALCNLGNLLDDSGRWLEAYQCYADALEADPSNGNAAGNAAELLRRRIVRGIGLPGHYAAVYEQYRQQAIRNRSRTVELAGEATARRWDALPLGEAQGHVSHDGDPLNEYQQWIKRHRLALTAAVEGLGSDDPRWDSAGVGSVAVDSGEIDPPKIFTSMNLLKADYLVARRLVFEGETAIEQTPFDQRPDDTGTYANTLDMTFYGMPPAQLVLAQRATLDLLDKIAVTANDHFKTGLAPMKVEFSKYWTFGERHHPRPGLPVPSDRVGAAIALGELAFDLSAGGLYPEANALRNAGTHRLVGLTYGRSTGITDEAHSSVDAGSLIRAAHEALRVARAAFLYLVDLVHDEQDARQNQGAMLPLPLSLQD